MRRSVLRVVALGRSVVLMSATYRDTSLERLPVELVRAWHEESNFGLHRWSRFERLS
jgi:hypothetical protein